MRMWGVPPEVLCQKHLLGEHVECHMMAGSLRKGISTSGYTTTGLYNLSLLRYRHDELVEEMIRRGLNHKSPLPEFPLPGNPARFGFVDIAKSLEELCNRCDDCLTRIWDAWGEEIRWTEKSFDIPTLRTRSFLFMTHPSVEHVHAS